MSGVKERKLVGLKKKPRYWTDGEDSMLASAVAKVQSEGVPKHAGDNMWKKVAAYVPNRAWRECLQRWTKVLVPGLKKGKWSRIEDDTLLTLVNQQMKDNPSKISWPDVSKGMGFRSCKQCRERWINHLDPTVKKGDWTLEEDEILLRVGKQFPSKWAKIARHIQGRTENTVKVRWKILKRQEWKPEEDRELLRLTAMYPRNWRMIAFKLQGRNERNVKQRLHTLSQERPEAVSFLQKLALPKANGRTRMEQPKKRKTKQLGTGKKRKRVSDSGEQETSGLDVLLETAVEAKPNVTKRLENVLACSPVSPEHMGLYMQQQFPYGMVMNQTLQTPMTFINHVPFLYNTQPTPDSAMAYMASLSAQMHMIGNKAQLPHTVNTIPTPNQTS